LGKFANKRITLLVKSHRSPVFYAWLSIATSIVTIAFKYAAYHVTGSVGLLSDALESFVNLGAALVALGVLTYAEAGPDPEHNFGHDKAEYFASGIEGTLILVAAVAIVWGAVPRLIAPVAVEQIGLGLVLSVLATAANALCAWLLLGAAKAHRSITLEADARHLLSDVWTTVGVVVGVLLAVWSGWYILDPLVAIAVALRILWTGGDLMRQSFDGLMDRAIPVQEQTDLVAVLDRYRVEGCDYHQLRTRQAGKRSFVDVHILVRGATTVSEGHDLVERIEADIKVALPHVEVLTHLEPIEDPRSYEPGMEPHSH
jgi:cation diffusion facilitator family transporter